MKEFLINYFWIFKLVLILICILSVVLMWKFGSHDYKKKLGVSLGEQYRRTKENDEIAKYLCGQSDLWGYIFIMSIMIMVFIFIAETIIKIVSLF